MAKYSKTKCDKVSGTSSQELWKEIKREMEEVTKETDIAFTTDFWTNVMGESFMTMSMHWIT